MKGVLQYLSQSISTRCFQCCFQTVHPPMLCPTSQTVANWCIQTDIQTTKQLYPTCLTIAVVSIFRHSFFMLPSKIQKQKIVHSHKYLQSTTRYQRVGVNKVDQSLLETLAQGVSRCRGQALHATGRGIYSQTLMILCGKYHCKLLCFVYINCEYIWQHQVLRRYH